MAFPSAASLIISMKVRYLQRCGSEHCSSQYAKINGTPSHDETPIRQTLGLCVGCSGRVDGFAGMGACPAETRPAETGTAEAGQADQCRRRAVGGTDGDAGEERQTRQAGRDLSNYQRAAPSAAAERP